MQVQTFLLQPTKTVPNSTLPLLFYPAIFPSSNAAQIETKFRSNKWIPQVPSPLPGSILIPSSVLPSSLHWRYSMYRESHYHSTTHECLGIFRGHAKLRFGVSNDDNPDDAIVLDVKSGDVIVVPAGVAHCALNESGEFCMVGAYPEGAAQWDMCYGGEDIHEHKSKISEIPLPENDPIEGSNGPLKQHWKK